MGHASIQMTVDIYGSWLPIRCQGAVDALSAAAAPNGSSGDILLTSEGFQVQQAQRVERA
jgi:hypothetical protein